MAVRVDCPLCGKALSVIVGSRVACRNLHYFNVSLQEIKKQEKKALKEGLAFEEKS